MRNPPNPPTRADLARRRERGRSLALAEYQHTDDESRDTEPGWRPTPRRRCGCPKYVRTRLRGDVAAYDHDAECTDAPLMDTRISGLPAAIRRRLERVNR